MYFSLVGTVANSSHVTAELCKCECGASTTMQQPKFVLPSLVQFYIKQKHSKELFKLIP